ncbi:pentapeptide repeat-containing protein [Streptomyces sp. NPDC006627]|uniref:pentapeptide repeat-containing protein n=1 Tax=Streptomyces sp. NPDC006627 TaxID=3154679 RepID=UPI0033BAC4AF
MTNRSAEELLRELLYLAAPDAAEEGRAEAARVIASHGDEALTTDELMRLTATVEGAELGGADSTPVALRGANLARANLYQVNLAGADLRNADLSECDLTFSDLSAARLSDCDLRSAILDDAVLDGADLAGARLERASLRDATLANARLLSVVLQNADLTGADLASIIGPLDLDMLLGVRWTHSTRWPASQPDLSREITENSVQISPGIFRIGRDDSRRGPEPDRSPPPVGGDTSGPFNTWRPAVVREHIRGPSRR